MAWDIISVVAGEGFGRTLFIILKGFSKVIIQRKRLYKGVHQESLKMLNVVRETCQKLQVSQMALSK